MISGIPIGASKAELTVVEPPSKEEIQDIITAAAAASGADSENEEEASDEHMDDAGGAVDEVARALNVAYALGKADKLDDIALGLKELDMEHYDDEDEGVEVFSSGIGDLYYPSIDQDPYIKDKNDDDDSEELEDMIINSTDSVIVCARTEDDLSLLELNKSSLIG
ncbi:periodic tryptophan protein 1-like [Arachis hypogaea]|uniref:periodic tryptophan protein 1-like n=1 Tax=Arachis hypogaea TaxID=3818 RepID=UPI003B2230CA